MRTYASLAALKASLSIPEQSDAQDERLALALVLGTAWVDHYLGIPSEPVIWTGEADDLDVVSDPPAHLVGASLIAATRFAKSPDVPFGVAGGLGDLAVHVSKSIPEAELALFGYREKWGIS